MKYHNNVDEFFNEKLSQSEIPMPDVEELWQRINQGKTRNKYPFYIWLLTGLVVILVAISGWSVFIKTDNTIGLGETQNFKQKILNSRNQEDLKSKFKTDSLRQKLLNQSNENSSIAYTSMIKELNEELKETNENNANRNSEALLGDSFLESNSIVESQDDYQMNETSRSKFIDNEVFDLQPKILKSKSLSFLSLKDDYNLDYNRPLPVLPFSILTGNEIISITNNKNWYGEVSLTSSLVSNRFSALDIDPTVFEEWQERVDPLSSFQFSLSIGRKINSNSSVSIGFEYQHIDNQYSEDSTVIQNMRLWHPEAFITSNGFVGDSVAVEVLTTTTLLRPYRETFVNIPLEYNYKFLRRSKFSMDLNLGLIINLSREESGQVLTSDNEWINVESRSQNRIGLSYDLGLSVNYLLKNDQSLFFALRVRYNPTDHQENLAFNLNRQYYGIEIGYRFAF